MIHSAVLAHWMLSEKLNIFGMLGCVLCITGSLTIVLHAPEEQPIHSLLQVWLMAMQRGGSWNVSFWPAKSLLLILA